MSEIGDLASAIREHINDRRRQTILLRDPSAWNIICSSLDAIDDTQMALDAYFECDWPNSTGLRYIFLYGVLQTLIVQQDAVQNLADALGLEYHADLYDVREARNNSIGHPTKRGRGRGWAYNFIARYSLAQDGFELLTAYADDRADTFQHINIAGLAAKQKESLAGTLSNVAEKLEQETMEHRQEFRDRLLTAVIPNTLGYHLSKVGESMHGRRPLSIDLVDFAMLERTVSGFRELYHERSGQGSFDVVDQLLDDLNYALRWFRSYLESRSSDRFTVQDAYVYFYYIHGKFHELEEAARELDEPYFSRKDD